VFPPRDGSRFVPRLVRSPRVPLQVGPTNTLSFPLLLPVEYSTSRGLLFPHHTTDILARRQSWSLPLARFSLAPAGSLPPLLPHAPPSLTYTPRVLSRGWVAWQGFFGNEEFGLGGRRWKLVRAASKVLPRVGRSPAPPTLVRRHRSCSQQWATMLSAAACVAASRFPPLTRFL
jgi:hypothetical protein